MKNFTQRLTMLLLAMLTSLWANAWDFYDDDRIYYSISKLDGKTCWVTAPDWDNNSDEYYGNVVIPSKVTHNGVTYTVVGIDQHAFWGSNDVRSVTLPNTLKWIESEAFKECESLSSIVVPSSVEKIYSGAFRGCTSLSSVSLPGDLKYLGAGVFEDCPVVRYEKGLGYVGTYLVDVKDKTQKTYSLRSNTTHICSEAFSDCESMMHIALPDGMKRIGNFAFRRCYSLKFVNLGSSLISIGNEAFSNCSLVSIELPSTIEEVGEGAFKYSGALDEVLCNAVHPTFLNDKTFDNTSIHQIYVPEESLSEYKESSLLATYAIHPLPNLRFESNSYIFKLTDGSTCTYRDYLTSYPYFSGGMFEGETNIKELEMDLKCVQLPAYMFIGCTSLESVTIFAQYYFTGLDGMCFKDCSSLKSFTFESEYKANLGEEAFYGCTSLESFTLPERTEAIGERAFEGCTSLTAVSFPTSIADIGYRAFWGCTSLQRIDIPSDNINYTSLDGVLFNKDKSTIIVYPGGKTGNYIIPDGVSTIERSAFAYCEGLTGVTISTSVTDLGAFAFFGCNKLTHIDIPSSVTSIGISAFNGTSIENLIFPEGVTAIPNYVAYSNSSLRSVTIPASVTSVGKSAFEGCVSLVSVTCEATTTPTTDAIIFKNLPEQAILYVPYSSINLYESDAKWASFSRILGIGMDYDVVVTDKNGQESTYVFLDGIIPECQFEGNKDIVSVEIHDGIKTIGNRAFSDCTNINSVGIAETVTSIGDEAFSNCSSLTSITIPEGVTSIGNRAFSGSSLTSITIPNSVTDMGNNVFSYCHNLETVTFGTGLSSIKEETFWDCDKLTIIDISESIKTIEASTFVNCRSLSTVNIHDIVAWCSISGLPNMMNSGNETKTLLVDGKKVSEIDIPAGVLTITSSAFSGFSNIYSVSVPSSVQNIGDGAFQGCSNLECLNFASSSPAEFDNSPQFPGISVLIVPTDAYNDYIAAWAGYKTQIAKADQYEQSIKVKAQDKFSTLHESLGEENLLSIGRLTVEGTINSYDIMVIRNKMVNLKHLDLSKAKIVASDYEYYTGYHSEDDVIGDFAFAYLNLRSIKLPSIRTIKDNAFTGSTLLHTVEMQEGVTEIGVSAFSGCSSLESCNIPEGVTSISEATFMECSSLTGIKLPSTLKSIGNDAFKNCNLVDVYLPDALNTIGEGAFSNNALKVINFPPNLNKVDAVAFSDCSQLEIARINPMLKEIGDMAFYGCNNLKKVYTYTVEPTNINQNTFSAWKSADLYVPKPSYMIYWYDTQWSQFLSVNRSDEVYDYKSFYVNGDFEIKKDTIGNKPNGEFNSTSSITNNGDLTQEFGTLQIKFDGRNGSATVIANGNIHAEKVHVQIKVDADKWYFFSFPFDIPLEGISCSGNTSWVVRQYNGESRAEGNSGWENLPADATMLYQGRGYIFRTNSNSTLNLHINSKTTFFADLLTNQLSAYQSGSDDNASWNFVGNPGLSYYDIDNLQYNGPITIWDEDAQQYVAVRPGDDDIFLHPFQAFFVQKPDDVHQVTYDPDDRLTYSQADKLTAAKARARKTAAKESTRKLVNLEITNGVDTDKTRVVFNNEKGIAYEMDCDAAKFESAGKLQLYSLDVAQTKYAINERPYCDGTVRLGFTATKEGRYSIQATRMDMPCKLKDTFTGETFDLNIGSYDFESKAGTFESRFVLVGTEPTAIESLMADGVNIHSENGAIFVQCSEDAFIYNASGALVAKGNGRHSLAKGTYVVKVGKQSTKIIVK